MTRRASFVLSLLLAGAAPVFAQAGAVADAAGEWAVTFATPGGPEEFTMFVAQNGAKLSGRLTSDAGEFPLTGTVDGNHVRIVWSFPEQGKILEITFTATIDGDSMTGTAKLDGLGQGPMSAERTAR
jgi:phosphate-selective porin